MNISGNFFQIGSIERKLAVTMAKVLTKEEARELLAKTGQIHELDGIKSNKGKFCFVSCHGIPEHFDKNWLIATSPLPYTVTPRDGLRSGIVDTIEKYIFIHCQGKELFEDLDNKIINISLLDFITMYANYTCSKLWDNLGMYFLDVVGYTNNEYLQLMDNEKAFWYIITNYVELE